MGLGRVGVVFLIVAALAGCGDDDGGGGGGDSGVDTAQATAQDSQAKANAAELTAFVEACFADEQAYSACTQAAGSEDVGQAIVENATATTYVIVSPSESGNQFRATRDDKGTLGRACTKAGVGGCPTSGEW